MATERENAKQGLTRAEDLTIELPRDATLPTIDQTEFTNLIYSLIFASEGPLFVDLLNDAI